jgi:hypothetical protein
MFMRESNPNPTAHSPEMMIPQIEEPVRPGFETRARIVAGWVTALVAAGWAFVGVFGSVPPPSFGELFLALFVFSPVWLVPAAIGAFAGAALASRFCRLTHGYDARLAEAHEARHREKLSELDARRWTDQFLDEVRTLALDDPSLVREALGAPVPLAPGSDMARTYASILGDSPQSERVTPHEFLRQHRAHVVTMLAKEMEDDRSSRQRQALTQWREERPSVVRRVPSRSRQVDGTEQ